MPNEITFEDFTTALRMAGVNPEPCARLYWEVAKALIAKGPDHYSLKYASNIGSQYECKEERWKYVRYSPIEPEPQNSLTNSMQRQADEFVKEQTPTWKTDSTT